MKMWRSFLSLVAIVSLVSCQQLPSDIVQSNYCNTQNLTTPELLLQIGQDYNQPANRSSFNIQKTQHYERNSTTISLGYVQYQDDLIIQQTSANLMSQVYTEDIDNKLTYIDGRDGYIVALESMNNTDDQYVLLKADIDTGLNTVMSNYQLTTTQDENQTQTEILEILYVDQSQMYVLGKQDIQQALYKIDLTQSQNQANKQLVFIANINEPQRVVDLIGGNIYHLYDRNSMRFYELSTDPITQQQSYAPKMLNELGIDILMDLDTLQFVSLTNNLNIMFSYLNGQTIIIPLTQNEIQASQAITMEGQPQFYTDNWKNCLIVTDNDFLWIRSESSGSNSWSYKQFSTTLPISQRDQLQAIMSNAQFISFDQHYAMVVSQNVGSQQQGSLTSVLYDDSTAPYFTIVDKLTNSIDLSQLNFQNQSNNNTTNISSTYSTSFKCNCVSLQVQTFQCFSGPLKCITLTKSVRDDCTKTS